MTKKEKAEKVKEFKAKLTHKYDDTDELLAPYESISNPIYVPKHIKHRKEGRK